MVLFAWVGKLVSEPALLAIHYKYDIIAAKSGAAPDSTHETCY